MAAAENDWWKYHSHTPQTCDDELMPRWLDAAAADRSVLSIARQYEQLLHLCHTFVFINIIPSLIHDLLFLPISTIESRVSYRVVTHSRGLFTLEWTHPAIQTCLFHTTMVMELS